MRKAIFLSLVGFATAGCGGPAIVAEGSSTTTRQRPIVTFVAVDTSGSARGHHAQLFTAAKSELVKIPSKEQVYVYRFDHDPAEVFSGSPPDQERAPHLIRELMKHQTDKAGTNLAKLFERMQKQITAIGCRAKVVVFTDSGTELMTREEKDVVRQLTRQWASQGDVAELRFVGVAGGQRESLRDMIEMPKDRLRIE